MSSLKPIEVLKGKITKGYRKLNIQGVLIVFQYAISIVLLISSIIIYQQFKYIQNRPLGYSKDHIVTIPVRSPKVRENFSLLKEKWLANPYVQAASISMDLPIEVESSTLIYNDVGAAAPQEIAIYRNPVGFDFIDLYEMELLSGRDFSKEIPIDRTQSYILNESGAKALGYTPEEAIGKTFDDFGNDGESSRTIIGVVRDFHMHSMKMAIEPVMMRIREDYFRFISIKVNPENLPKTLAFIEETTGQYSNYPFEYQFIDEAFDELYKSDYRIGELFGFFTLLSILIASLGLFGLAAFTTGQRQKEVGVRKVLGATITQVLAILAKDFIFLVFIGFLIAIPITWWSMSTWLSDFAYRINIQWWVFLLGGLAAVVMALISISTQSIKAALSNPVDVLKNE